MQLEIFFYILILFLILLVINILLKKFSTSQLKSETSDPDLLHHGMDRYRARTYYGYLELKGCWYDLQNAIIRANEIKEKYPDLIVIIVREFFKKGENTFIAHYIHFKAKKDKPLPPGSRMGRL